MTTNDRWARVDRYLEDTLLEPDPVLDETLRSGAAAGLPAINVTPNQGKVLSILATVIGARRILELGTLAGYSTIWLARAVAPGGTVVTIEADEKHAAVARRNFERAGLSGTIDLRVGRGLDLLPAMASREPPFDLVFIDADKENYPGYLEWVVRLTRVGALIVADNIVRDGAVADEASTDARVQGVRQFMAALGADRRLSAAALQTVSAKAYDGFAIAVVMNRDLP